MGILKLGRQAPVWTDRHLAAAARFSVVLDGLGQPPAQSSDWTSAVTELVDKNWDMYGNDQVGDCFWAGEGHYQMLRTANTGTWHKPSTADILTAYHSTGYEPGRTGAGGVNPTDRGTVISTGCDYMRDQGICGHRSDGTAAIAVGAIDDNALLRARWAIELYGAVGLGVNLPDSAETQFTDHAPWTFDPQSDNAIEGGHYVLGVGYTGGKFLVVTWGGLTAVDPDWLKRFGEEAHIEAYSDFLMSTGKTPSGFDHARLMDELTSLAAA